MLAAIAMAILHQTIAGLLICVGLHMHTEAIDEIDLNNLEYIFNHVFLPPKLPDQADKNSEKNTSALLDVVEEAARAYQKQLTGSVQPRIQARWDSSIKMLSTLGELQNSKSLSKEKLSSAIENMGTGGNGPLNLVSCISFF